MLGLLFLLCANAVEWTWASCSQELSGCGERRGDYPGTRHRPLEIRTQEEIDAVRCEDIGSVGRPQNRYWAKRVRFGFPAWQMRNWGGDGSQESCRLVRLLRCCQVGWQGRRLAPWVLFRLFQELKCSLITRLGLLIKIFLVVKAHNISQVHILAMISFIIPLQQTSGELLFTQTPADTWAGSWCGARLICRGSDSTRVGAGMGAVCFWCSGPESACWGLCQVLQSAALA